MQAFDLALHLGATGLETDVWITGDGTVVLDHDGTVGGRFRKKSIRSLARSALPDHIPTLAEFYENLDVSTPLSVDIKDPAAFEPLLNTARDHGAEDSLWLCHPDLDLLVSWRRKTSARLVHSTRLGRLDGGPERHAARLRDLGIDVVNFRQGDWSGGLIALYHRFERLTMGWAAQQPREIVKLIDAGIDGVISDHADRLADALAQFFDQEG